VIPLAGGAGYLAVGGVAAVVCFALGFPVRRLAVRWGAVVPPDPRRVHTRPTPTAGGAAMLVGLIAALAFAGRLSGLQGVFVDSSEPIGVALAAVVIFGVGLVDDVRDISAPAKVAGQVLAASVLYYAGVTMYQIEVPLTHQVVVLSPSLTPLITAIWVIGIANAVNLIDGLDGLAAGIVAIAASAFCVYGLRLEHLGLLGTSSLGPLLAAAAAGVAVGFLPHNFHPAKIFMGDAGAMLLGLVMAASTSVVGGRTADVSGHSFFLLAPLVIPFVILGVPMVDTAFAIVRRTVRRTSFATADKAHLHHRLMQMGHGQRRSVLILWAWTALLAGFVLYPLYDRTGNAIVPFVAPFLVILLLTLFRPGMRLVAPVGAHSKRARHPDPRDPASATGDPGGEERDPGEWRRIGGAAPVPAGPESRGEPGGDNFGRAPVGGGAPTAPAGEGAEADPTARGASLRPAPAEAHRRTGHQPERGRHRGAGRPSDRPLRPFREPPR